jgi:AhpD family alkylhydroperoxidase
MPKKSTTTATILSPAVAELVAIGAAIGANCEPCFKYHYSQAREDMARAVALADGVKRAPARNMLVLAERILRTNLLQESENSPPSSCCTSKAMKSTKRKCC